MIFLHGIVAGILFGSEFGLIFVGLQYTLASRGYVLLYIAPFFAALGAHFFLVDDRLNIWKAAGLLSAFCGVVVLFMKDVGSFSFEALPGDVLFLIAGAAWGATTVFTPVFGVLFSGILILGKTISPNLVMALILVSLGMVLVNYQPRP